MTTSRANTLFDDADDLQKQLENEVRDRIKYGKGNTMWVLHFPTKFPISNSKTHRSPDDSGLLRQHVDMSTEYFLPLSAKGVKEWDYKGQRKWGILYPDCIGRSQSPVDLPYDGFTKVKSAKKMLFSNHDVLPKSLFVVNDGKSVKMSGFWNATKRPAIYGGATLNRRYIFDSLSLHWPSEHTISGQHYPMESQALYVSSKYGSVKEAQSATSDKISLLGVSSLYKFSNHSHKGLLELLRAALSTGSGNKPVSLHSLSYFNPPFKEYASYHGSLTAPSCTESVKWLVRARSLPVSRGLMDEVYDITVHGETLQDMIRRTQPLNDRKIYFFN